MKKIYEAPSVEKITYAKEDVLTDSNGFFDNLFEDPFDEE